MGAPDWCLDLAERMEPHFEIPGYMRRWVRLHREAGRVYLHNLLGPDDDVIHDHPWDFFTVVLSGGYLAEVVPNPGGEPPSQWRTTERLMAGDSAWLQSTVAHRIIEVEPNTWTLVTTGPRVRKWGFWVDRPDSDRLRFVPHSELAASGHQVRKARSICRHGYRTED